MDSDSSGKNFYGLDEALLKQVVEIIVSHKSVDKVVLFGSRSTGQYEKTSDIDLTIFGEGWTDKDLSVVRLALEEEVQTPLKFDILLFNKLEKQNLKEDILKDGAIIYEPKKD